jgi:hypothetical protein
MNVKSMRWSIGSTYMLLLAGDEFGSNVNVSMQTVN